MDQLAHYQCLIKQALTEYARLLKAPPEPPYDVVLAFDDEHYQYLGREIGWTEAGRMRQTILHVAIREGKIWIEEDWTEEGVATYFLEHDIPPQNIVLGFYPPPIRALGEFATA